MYLVVEPVSFPIHLDAPQDQLISEEEMALLQEIGETVEREGYDDEGNEESFQNSEDSISEDDEEVLELDTEPVVSLFYSRLGYCFDTPDADSRAQT